MLHPWPMASQRSEPMMCRVSNVGGSLDTNSPSDVHSPQTLVLLPCNLLEYRTIPSFHFSKRWSTQFNTKLTLTMAFSNLCVPHASAVTTRRNDSQSPVGVGQLQVPLAQLLFRITEPLTCHQHGQHGDPRHSDPLPLEPPQPFRVNTVAGLHRVINDVLAMMDDEEDF